MIAELGSSSGRWPSFNPWSAGVPVETGEAAGGGATCGGGGGGAGKNGAAL